MTAVGRVIRILLAAAPWAMVRGAVLSVVVLLMGAALLGLSGWFITATGLAGLAGIGIAFDVFRPSAGVRFLALGRTAARYGERLLTHDATLRALAALRVTLLERQAGLGARALSRLRGEASLTRIVSDVDALDGLVLRLLLPAAAGLAAHLAVFLVLAWLVGWIVALAILAGYLPAAAMILSVLARRGLAPSAEAEELGQSLRRGVIDMIRDRKALILGGRLAQAEDRLVGIDAEARAAACRLDRAERDAGATLAILVSIVTGLALLAGGWLLSRDMAGAATAAIGLFVALALAETVLPLRRGFAEFGRMAGAAARIAPDDAMPATGGHERRGVDGAPLLEIATGGLALSLAPGEAVALTGPSGSGKTTLLMQIAGLEPGEGIAIRGHAPEAWDEAELRAVLTMVPQRSALIAGTIRDNLSLVGNEGDRAMWDALDAVAMADVVRERGGLDVRLNEGGAGLSGGQARRLALARAVLKRPQLLLLDEPTEGLDEETADRVLTGIRHALPETAVFAALHRGSNHPVFGSAHKLSGQFGDDVTKA